MNTESPSRRRSMLFGVSHMLLLPRDARNVPVPIAEANEHAWAKLEAYEAASTRVSEAEQIANAAPTSPRKRDKAEAARHEAEAAERVAKLATLELWDAVEAHQSEYLEGREAAYAKAIEAPSKALDALESSLASVESEAELLDCARAWHNNVRSAALSSNGRSPRDRVAKAERDLELRRRDRKDIDIPDRPEYLIVALRRHLERAAR
jgi:hypothetical protein